MKKKAIISLLTGVCIAISLMATFEKTEQSLSRNIIRLHIRANSDSAEDQALKLKVRDRILKESSGLLKGAKSKDEVYNIIGNNLDYLVQCAENEVYKNGYTYPVEVTLGKSVFPTKAYDDIYLPGGTYEALIVNIGNGAGYNWWCVIFPPMCFAEGTVDGNGEKMLKDSIDKNAYDMIKGEKPKIKFKTYELWQKIMK